VQCEARVLGCRLAIVGLRMSAVLPTHATNGASQDTFAFTVYGANSCVPR
jgi:hypothetical protein